MSALPPLIKVRPVIVGWGSVAGLNELQQAGIYAGGWLCPFLAGKIWLNLFIWFASFCNLVRKARQAGREADESREA
jgi:hypothetical protein